MHHYKAPHDYFENAERYDLTDIDIPEPRTLWDMNSKFGSLATRGHNDELVPHIGLGQTEILESYFGSRTFPK